jgi:hypothetical protein
MNTNAELIERAQEVLLLVRFFNYEFSIREGHGGVFLQAMYEDKDIYTGKVEPQYTRKWLLSPAMTRSEIVQTAFKCCMTSFEHRCREAFTYEGARIFGPHFDVDDLAQLCKAGREDGGARLPPEGH